MFDEFSMYQVVEYQTKKHPNRMAVHYQGTNISFKRFLRRTDRMADILVNRLGVKRNDVVLVAQPNIPDTLVLIYALNKIGAVANLVHPFTPFNQIRSIMLNTNTKIAFLFEQRVAKEVEQYREIADKIYVTRIEDDLPLIKKAMYHTFMNRDIRKKLGKFRGSFKGFNYVKDLKPTGKGAEVVTGKQKELSVLLHSGSTTGDPKTIRLNDYAFNFIVKSAKKFICLDPEDLKCKAMLSVLPSFHGFGFCMTMHQPLAIGCGVVLVPKYSAKEVCKTMKKAPWSLACVVPTMLENLLKSEEFRNHKGLKNIRVIFSGGDYLPPAVRDDFNGIMESRGYEGRVMEGYGLTEAIAVNTINTLEEHRDGSIGKAIPGVTVKILDEDCNEVPLGEIGEICLTGGANMLGYFKNEAATEEAMKGGYIHTGDLGTMDEDGFVFYKSRKKRVIKVSGVGVFPSEIENLVAHIPGVKASCAIEIPDARLQHAVKLFVIADYFDEVGMRNTIIETCRKYLIRWSIPKEIEFVNELPKTLLGKIDFKKLQADEDAKRRG